MSRRQEGALVVGLLLLAAVVRLARPGLTEFKADEARLLTLALTTAGGDIAVRGISSSVGFPNAPMSVWLYALPLLVWPHAYAATLFTGLLGVAAVAGVYWLARRYWGVRAAAVAALLLAVSPWAIHFSRKIWAQNLLPAFAVAWAIAAALAFVEGRRGWILAHLALLAVVVQIHPAAIGLAPATLLFLVVFRRRVSWRLVIVGMLLAALTVAPFLWYLWGRWRAEGGLPFSSSQSAAQLSAASLRQTLHLITGSGLRPLAGPEYAGLPGEAVVRALWLALLLAGAAWAVYHAWRRWPARTAQMAFVGLVWFLTPPLLFAWRFTPVYVHYFIVALPAPYLLAGAFVGSSTAGWRRPWRITAWAALVVVAGLQLVAWSSLLATVARDPAAGGFGVPLRTKLAAADAARDLQRRTDAVEILLAGDGADPEEDTFPAEFRALLHGAPLRLVDLRAEAVFPGHPAIVLMDMALSAPPAAGDLYLAAGDPVQTVDLNNAPVYAAVALPAAAAPAPAVALAAPPLLANFVRLIGHSELSPAGIWDVYWRPADDPDPADYHIFNHLLDGGGARVAQSDAAAFSGAQWRPADVVVSRFRLLPDSPPAPPLSMRVGMYRFPSLESVPILDEAANPSGDAVELPLDQ